MTPRPAADQRNPEPDPEPANAAAAIDRSRLPVRADAITALLPESARWSIATTLETGSTNADLAAEARAGDGRDVDCRVLVAEVQVAGKGRLGRVWTAPPGAGLTMSVLVTVPTVPPARRSWIGAIAGLALVEAVRSVGVPTAALKWPNDLLVAGRKSAGILAEAVGDALIVGIGLNVSLRSAELPRPDATSLLLSGSPSLDRTALAAALLGELISWVDRWRAVDGDADACGLRQAYIAVCATLGQTVRAELPSGEHIVGVAQQITADGALVIGTPGGARTFSAADVFHLRST